MNDAILSCRALLPRPNGHRAGLFSSFLPSPYRLWRQYPPMIGWTLGRYLSLRILVMIAAVFLLNAGMIYVVDFVELLRRSGYLPAVSAGYIAYLSFLRVPALCEQIMPFCVLFGTMATFLILSRKLELLVARAAGLSAWGFLFPPLAIAAFIGIASVVVFNPIALQMKQRADLIETRISSFRGRQNDDPTVWIRQSSIDGEAFIKASQTSPDGTRLTGATAYVYDPAGAFEHRINASTSRLLPGAWQFLHAQVTTPGEESVSAGAYLLATGLSGDEIVRGTIAPDAVPFWDLPAAGANAETAGFDGTGYRMQYHMLLARPLFYIAMVLIAAAFSLRFFRFGGIERMVMGGVGAGFMLYGAVKFVGDLGGAGLLSPAVAAWSPAATACLLSAFALLKQEDG
ncbi:MAG: LPS export ABC transporter permease LptG [Beijerinckiaceae bacterium]|nr:LPS export ABC transporter permease LptG [Beijerinckiaceae bacterium]